MEAASSTSTLKCISHPVWWIQSLWNGQWKAMDTSVIQSEAEFSITEVMKHC